MYLLSPIEKIDYANKKYLVLCVDGLFDKL